MLKKEGVFWATDFGAHSVAQTCVSAHFESLKAEVLGSCLIDVAEFKEHVVDKAARFEKDAKCKANTSNPLGGMFGDDPLHFEIANGSALSAQHLQSVILYCDFSDYCASRKAPKGTVASIGPRGACAKSWRIMAVRRIGTMLQI